MNVKSLSRAEKLDWLRLINSENVGPATFHALLARYRTAAKALEKLPELSARGGHGSLRIFSKSRAEDLLDQADGFGAELIASIEPTYPKILGHIDAAPPLIWVKGDLTHFARSAVAVVGSRNASAVGRTMARRFAAELGHSGMTVVSGLARGIDTAAHEASLETGTIAVLAGGIDVVYPPENAPLAEAIGTRGILITEMMPGTQPQAKHFPRRNRLIAGLSLGVVVVEAADRSGSLITARLAIEQGREVFAVPGSPMDPRSTGTNSLIRRGATLVTCAGDVLEALEPMQGVPRERGFSAHDDDGSIPIDGAPEPLAQDTDVVEAERNRIISLLGPAPVEIDVIIREADIDVGKLYIVLLELELAGRLVRSGGRHVALIQ